MACVICNATDIYTDGNNLRPNRVFLPENFVNREPSFPALPGTELELVIIILLGAVRDGAESEGSKAGGGWDYGNIVLYSAEQGGGHTDTGHADIHYAAVTNRIREKQVCIFFRYNFMKHLCKGFNIIRFPVSIAHLY